MKWISADDLEGWANATLLSRAVLSEIVSSLIRASATSPQSFRFPSGDSAQLPGYDGSLEWEGVHPYVPEGKSVWEFSTERRVQDKAKKDYDARKKDPRAAAPAETTFVFVTPREWPGADKWAKARTEEKFWKSVRALDAVDLESWLGQSPAVASRVAGPLLNLKPNNGAGSTDEFWSEYASEFEPPLTEAVLLAGRSEQSQLLLQQLQGIGTAHPWMADSLDEVIAFAVATIRNADPEVRKYLEAKTLVVDTRDAARQMVNRKDLIFLLRGSAAEIAGSIGKRAPVVVPIGQDQANRRDANVLKRPHFDELAESLRTMGLGEKEANNLARACGRSVTILARRIPYAKYTPPNWSTDRQLIPALLACGWSIRSEQDLAAVQALTDQPTYAEYEKSLLQYLGTEDSPLDREDDVWQMRAPVDAFVHMGGRISSDDLGKLEKVVIRVFSETDPVLELPPGERFYAGLTGKKLKHSDWIRTGLATTLLLIAEFHDEAGLQTPGTTPQDFVDQLIARLPGLDSDYRALAGLYGILPIVAEAAPRPLLRALGRLIEGDGSKIRPIFQDEQVDSFYSSSPHSALLWALEVLAWDPLYISDATLILAGLARIDPGGKLANRPLNSLREIFLVWHPSTNANMEQRFAALDQIVKREPRVGWELLIKLMPEFYGVASPTSKPRYRESGASQAEVVTYGTVGKGTRQIVERVLKLVGTDPDRWVVVIRQLSSFSPQDRARAVELLGEFAKSIDQASDIRVWSALRAEVNRHRRYPSAEWAMKGDDLRRLEEIVAQLQPSDVRTQVAWLFDDHHPDLPDSEEPDPWVAIQLRRKEAIQQLYRIGGMSDVLDLASRVKYPGFVGYAFADVADVIETEAIIDMSLQRDAEPNGFAIALSAGADHKFKSEWRSKVAGRYRDHHWTAAQVGRLLLDWRDELPAWVFVASLGEEVERAYWSQKIGRPIDGQADALEFMATKYLAYGRALAALEGVSYRSSLLSSHTLLRVLDAAIDEINSAVLKIPANLAYEVEQIFNVLRSRPEVAAIEVARREYAYLPLLGYRRTQLTIHSLLVQDADFFFSLLKDVFKSASGDDRDITEERRTRAVAGYRVLSECHTVPGLKDGAVDEAEMTSWVVRVRELATANDRAVIADEYIGHILAYSPHDADGAWPHRAVRNLIENIASPKLEQGIAIERFNMRGPTTRGPFDGGDQERALAKTIREWSKVATAWPRTSKLLEQIAQDWENHAQAEDVRARQDELRFS
jgi:hypothetical protein